MNLFGGFTPTYVHLAALCTVRTTVEPVTISMRVDYYEPIVGPEFIIESRILKKRGRTTYVEARLFDPPDTLAVDSMAALADTLAVPADTIPPPSFRAILGGPPPIVGANVFAWDRDALMLEAALTLGDLLEQVPGVTLLRDGLFLQPEAATAFGQTRGRIEVVLDGFILDPLTTSTLDLATLELAQMSELRVERRLDVTRIVITTIEPSYATPYSRLEAGTGEPSGSLLRGVVTSPHLLLGPLAFTVDRIDGNGRGGGEPADIVGVWAKWGWFPSPEHAFQVEYQHGRLRRTAGVPWSGELTGVACTKIFSLQLD